MKKMSLVLSMMMTLGFIVSGGCVNAPQGWPDLPAYPGASQLSVRTWPISQKLEELMDLTGRRYYSSDASWHEVADYYNKEFSAMGWSDMSDPQINVPEALVNYYTEISLYEDVNLLETYSYFSKNDGKESAVVWIGLRVTQPQPGKTYITFWR